MSWHAKLWIRPGILVCIYIYINQYSTLWNVHIECNISNCRNLKLELSNVNSMSAEKNPTFQILNQSFYTLMCVKVWNENY